MLANNIIMNQFLHNYHLAAEECARYIIDSQTEQESYMEFLQDGNDPRDHILYHAAFILGKTKDFDHDIENYLNA